MAYSHVRMFDSYPASRPTPQAAALVAAIESGHREESVLVAQRMAAVAALLRHRVAAAERAEEQRGYAVIDGFEQTTAEVAAAMNLSPAGASYLVSYAETLDKRLPNVAALLGEGRTDWRTVRLIISRSDLVTDDELVAKLDQSLAARIGNWHGWSRQRIVNAVDAAVCAADPDAARERREAAEDDRSIAISALDNGMAEIYGNVAAATATAFDQRLSQLAKQVCPADPRTLDQRRADALAALTQGRRLACACGQPDCPTRAEVDAAAGDPGGARVVINVVASEQTLYGDSGAPGYLEGYGVIDAEQVRRLAEAAAVLIANPLTSPVEALRYQPSAALERAVRCRDLTCRFPGCSRPAVICDIDTPFRSTTRIGQPADGRYWKTSMSLPATSSAQNVRRVARYAIGGWHGQFVWDTPSLNSRVSGKTAANLYLSGFRPMSKRLQRRSSRTAARLRMVLTAEGIIELTPHRQLDTLSRTLCGRSLLPEVK